jgi:hypothetical protein
MTKQIIFITILCLIATRCFADTLYLKNGNRIKCTVISEDKDRVKVEIPNMGLMEFYAGEIDKIEKAPSEVKIDDSLKENTESKEKAKEVEVKVVEKKEVNAEPDYDSSRYYNNRHKFSAVFPQGWETKEDFMGADVVIMSPLESSSDAFRENMFISVQGLSKAQSADEFYKSAFNCIKKISGIKERKKGKITIDGRDAAWNIYTLPKGGFTTQTKEYYIVDGDRGILICCIANTKSSAIYDKIFEDIMRSFRFEE